MRGLRLPFTQQLTFQRRVCGRGGWPTEARCVKGQTIRLSASKKKRHALILNVVMSLVLLRARFVYLTQYFFPQFMHFCSLLSLVHLAPWPAQEAENRGLAEIGLLAARHPCTPQAFIHSLSAPQNRETQGRKRLARQQEHDHHGERRRRQQRGDGSRGGGRQGE